MPPPEEPQILSPQEVDAKARTERCVAQINEVLAANNCQLVPYLVYNENGIRPAARIQPLMNSIIT